ncbi:MAG: S8 family peptidase, partial [Acidimicrobiales bacterium]
GVVADVTPAALPLINVVAGLTGLLGVTITPDTAVQVAGMPAVPTRAPSATFAAGTGASQLAATGVTGHGVNVAVLDTGIDNLPDFAGRLAGGIDLSGGHNPFQDGYGHGTFVAGLIASNGISSGGRYVGEAPGAGLVSVKVAKANGSTDLGTVIAGIQWTVANKGPLGIRVLNLSLGAVPTMPTVLNPLDRAVEAAWRAGIVVVAAAGNDGPGNGTIVTPGDDPLVITAGALDDNGTPQPTDDTMTTFSSVGPTSPDGWLKPDLVAPGRSLVSLRAPGSTVDMSNPSSRIGSANFVGSGTSFSAGITSAAAALILQMHPGDSPNAVKGLLLGTASPGPVGSPLVDGHGALDVYAAATSPPM